MSLTLRITSYQNSNLGDNRSKSFAESSGTIGRSPKADWVLPDPKRYISNKHAAIEYQNGAYFITDLSTNGVYINRAADPLGKNNSVKLDNGDQITIGDYEIEVDCESQKHSENAFPDNFANGNLEIANTDNNYFVANANSDNRGLDAPEEDLFANISSTSGNDLFGSTSADNLLSDNGSNDIFPSAPNDDLFAAAPDDDIFANLGKADSFPVDQEQNILANDQLGSAEPIPKSIDPLDLLGVSPDNASSNNGMPQSSGNVDEFQEDSGQSALINHNAGIHENYSPPAATPEGMIPDDWDMTHFPERQVDNSAKEVLDFSQESYSTGEFEQQSSAMFGKLPDNWDKTGMPSNSNRPKNPQLESGQPKPPPPKTPPVDNRQQQSFANNPVSGAPSTPAFQQGYTAKGNEYERLLNSMGLDINAIPPEMAAELPVIIGTVFKELVHGVMEVLVARASLKGAFRVSQTIIKPVENNPLKFSINAEEAIKNMLFNQGKGYLSALDSVQQGVDDLKAHQMAMMAGMQAAFEAMLMRFDPAELAEHFDKSKVGGVFNKKSKYWDMYGKLFSKIRSAAQDNFQHLLGEEFAEAYEDQMSKLKPVAKPTGHKSNF